MELYLHLSCSLQRQLEKISHSSANSDQPMQKCKRLIGDLRTFGPNHEKVRGKRTRKGENRLKNCVKYDLGAGYRLVTVMNGGNLFVTFFGSHDETDHWFDRHKADDFTPDNPLYNSEKIDISRQEDSWPLKEEDGIELDPYEAQLEAKLDQNLLLSIFKGLNRQNSQV